MALWHQVEIQAHPIPSALEALGSILLVGHSMATFKTECRKNSLQTSPILAISETQVVQGMQCEQWGLDPVACRLHSAFERGVWLMNRVI